MTCVNIAGLDRAEIIAALYNASQPLRMSFLHYDPTDMTRAEAQSKPRPHGRPALLRLPQGRVMKVGFDAGSDEMRVDLYDRDNGAGALRARVIDGLRRKAA